MQVFNSLLWNGILVLLFTLLGFTLPLAVLSANACIVAYTMFRIYNDEEQS
jgi:hypothetical protein